MKKIYFLGILLFTILTMLFVYLNIGSQKYNSSYGFSTEVSTNWFIITKDSIENQKYTFDLKSKNLSEFLTSYIKHAKESVLNGNTELLFYKRSDPDFQDRITFFKIRDSKENHNERIKVLCNMIKINIKDLIKRDVNIYYCNLKKVYGIDTMTHSYDGETIGTKNIRYYFNTSDASIILNIDCKNNKCKDIQADAEKIIKNIVLD